MLQLDAPSVIEIYTAAAAQATAAGDEVNAASAAAITALAQAHLADVELAQQSVVAVLAEHDAHLLYRTQRVDNGVAVRAPVEQAAALATLPGVRAVYPIIAKAPANAKVAGLLNTPAIWEGIDRAGLTGQGVSIAVIDTGIDYLHTMFGGPGSGHKSNDTTVIGDAPNFPFVKVVGGYDFTGDTYDANSSSALYQPIPQPDPDPMDCYDFGHGTHVSGIAAGYGVQAADGATYRGPYDTSIDLNALRIAPGVAPLAQLYALKVFGCHGFSDIVDAAIEWAVDPNQDGDFSDRVDVINMSLGSSFGAPNDSTVIAVENAARLGIIVVASAGNTGDVHYAVGSPGMAHAAIAVAATQIDSVDSDLVSDGELAGFSSRGPSRDGSALKPDLAAPGVSIVSAQRGPGSLGTARSGTSMASPVVAGTMALLRQAHPEDASPSWRAAELKALAINTAHLPLTRADAGDLPYSLLRAGAGRIDATTALQSSLIAYDDQAPAQVSVSFGVVDVAGTVTQVRTVRVANKGNTPLSVTVGYAEVRALPGATVDVGAGTVITIPAAGFATLPVTLTLDAAKLVHAPDPTRLTTPVDSYPWLDEVSGLLTLTPVTEPSAPTVHVTGSAPSVIALDAFTPPQPAIHVPIHALPRVVSNVTVLGGPLSFGETPTATLPLTFMGDTLPGAMAPRQTVPLVGLFNLLHSSPSIDELPNGDPATAAYAHADLRYVGVAGPVTVQDIPMLYFALVTHGQWATPQEVQLQIEIDTNGDNVIDYRLSNRDGSDIISFNSTYTDEFVSMLETFAKIRTVQGPLNLFAPDIVESRVFNSNIMVLPLQLAELGSDVSEIRFKVLAYSRDLPGSAVLTLPIDRTPVFKLDLSRPQGIQLAAPVVPLRAIGGGESLDIRFHRNSYVEEQSQGLLILFPQNPFDARTLVLPAEYSWPYSVFLPAVRN